VSVDPDVQSTGTPFAYAGDNSISLTDYSGLCAICIAQWWDDTGGVVVHGLKVFGVGAWHFTYDGVQELGFAADLLENDISGILSKIFTAVSFMAGIVAIVGSSLAWVPLIGPAAEMVAITAGVVALAADVGNCIGGHCNDVALALDAAAMIPGIGALHASEIVDDSEKVLARIHISPDGLMRDTETGATLPGNIERTLKDTINNKGLWRGADLELEKYLDVGALSATFAESHESTYQRRDGSEQRDR